MTKIALPGKTAAERVAFLNLHDVFHREWTVGQLVWCLHCGKSFVAQDCRHFIYSGSTVWLICPNGQCDGNPVDWSDEPWF